MPIRNVLILILAILFANTSTTAQEVTLYRFQAFFGKEFFVAKPGRYDSIPRPLTDNNIISIKVPAGMKVTLYENRNCMGESFEFYGDVEDLRRFATITGRVSSFKVETNTRNITQQFITLDNITGALCPTAVLAGDREFGGNGPRMKCDVKLRIEDNGKTIYADIYLWAQETKHDWSATEAKWSKKVYEVFESNKRIIKIDMNERSIVEWISGSAPAEFGLNSRPILSNKEFWDEMKKKYPATNFDIWWKQYRAINSGALGYGNNLINIIPPLQGRLVSKYYIVGDTGGADISDDANCQDDTRIEKIEFNKVYVQMEQ